GGERDLQVRRGEPLRERHVVGVDDGDGAIAGDGVLEIDIAALGVEGDGGGRTRLADGISEGDVALGVNGDVATHVEAGVGAEGEGLNLRQVAGDARCEIFGGVDVGGE